MTDKLYWYQKAKVSLQQAVTEEVNRFHAKYGYWPKYVVVRDEEYDQPLKLPVKVVRAWKNLPPSHFRLGPFVQRTARVLPKRMQREAYHA